MMHSDIEPWNGQQDLLRRITGYLDVRSINTVDVGQLDSSIPHDRQRRIVFVDFQLDSRRDLVITVIAAKLQCCCDRNGRAAGR